MKEWKYVVLIKIFQLKAFSELLIDCIFRSMYIVSI